MKSSFYFLKTDYPELFAITELAEKLIHIDPSSSIAKSRLFGEKLATLVWEFEALDNDRLSQHDKIDQLYRESAIPMAVREVLHQIRKSGNTATHVGDRSRAEALFILKQCFRAAQWFFETYEDIQLGDISYQLPEDKAEVKQSELEAKLNELSNKIVDYEAKIKLLNSSKEVQEKRKKRSQTVANNLKLDEKETRLTFIDPKLRDAGWECDTETINWKIHKTMPQKGRNMAIAEWSCGTLWADYALFVGTTLYGLVEAKRFATHISSNLDQPKVYAKAITLVDDIQFLGKWEQYQVPYLFSTNGRPYLKQIETMSGIWFQDIRNSKNIARVLEDWYSPEGLVELHNRNIEEANSKLQQVDKDYLTCVNGLNLRDYQLKAIEKIEDKIINNLDDRRALLVMATGTGKTRTAIGLVHRLISSDRFRRILFLTDRRLLATQAYDDFKDKKVEALQPFGDIYDMKGLDATTPDSETRLHFATVQSLVKRLFYAEEGTSKLKVDDYDCIIVDEAHRGYNLDKDINEDDLAFKDQDDYVSQYKRVIHYFDAHIIGLTATPAIHTTEIFGKPTYTYSYREAVIDGHLIDHTPPFIIRTELSENGIVWEKGEKPQVFNPETGEIEELEMLEDEIRLEIEDFNKKVIAPSFNRTVVKELVKHITPNEDEKTLIFAARDTHADMIVDMLKEEFKEAGWDIDNDAIQKITGNSYDPELQTKYFKNERNPNIVVTVDLLTTGIDVPAISNIVFMRRIRSRILFEQMVGRATRKCDEIGKEYFQIFDAVSVYEALQDFTQMNTVSNPKYTFKELVEELDLIDDTARKKKQVEQIIAKIQRKKSQLTDERLDQFIRLSQQEGVEELIEELKHLPEAEISQRVAQLSDLWTFLDERVFKVKKTLYSDKPDAIVSVDRGYGNGEKPEDYILSFKEFILENKNKIMAINTICNKPNELDRASLKELRLILDQNRFNSTSLNSAWQSTKHVDITADIIAYIRTLALDVALITPEQRVKNAISKVKVMHSWTKPQLNLINRIESQLLQETIIQKEDFDKDPFLRDGGFDRMDKRLDNKLEEIIQVINDNLYIA